MTSPTGIAIAHRAFVVKSWLQSTWQMSEKQGSLHTKYTQPAPRLRTLSRYIQDLDSELGKETFHQFEIAKLAPLV